MVISAWDKKLELLDFCISQEGQQKLERAAASTLTIPCYRALEEPPETRTLPAAPRLGQSQFVLVSVSVLPLLTGKGWGNFTSPRLFQNFPTALAFLLQSHWRKAGLVTPRKWESFLRWFEAELNKAKIPTLNSHWHINSATEHKTAIFQFFVLKIPVSFRTQHPAEILWWQSGSLWAYLLS